MALFACIRLAAADTFEQITITDSPDPVIDRPDVTAVTKDVTLWRNAAETMRFANLTDVGGSLTTLGNAATSIAFPALTDVRWSVDVRANPALRSLDLRSLDWVDTLNISGNPALTDLRLDSLGFADEAFYLFDNDALPSIDLRFGMSRAEFSVGGNDGATAVNLPGLHTAWSSVRITDNRAAKQISAPNLGQVGSTRVFGELRITGNTAAETIDVGIGDVYGNVIIRDNGDARVLLRTYNDSRINGSLTLETTGPTFSYDQLFVLGAVSITARQTTRISGKITYGTASILMSHGPATLELTMPPQNAGILFRYSVEQRPTAEGPTTARDEAGSMLPVHPILSYTATTTSPSDFPVTLMLSLDLPSLTAVERVALRDALDDHAIALALLAVDGEYDLLTFDGSTTAVLLLDAAGARTEDFDEAATLQARTSAPRLASVSLVVVPEPACVAFLVVAAFCGGRRRRGK